MVKGRRIVKMVCGLGNADEKYCLTRHNIGFAALDVLAEHFGVRYWKNEAGCELASVELATTDKTPQQLLLARPLSYMNNCGGPLSKLMRAHRILPAELLVIHDEIDLAQGEVSLKVGGGLNGHNGLRSLEAKLQTRDFCRVRCGIGRPLGKMDVASFVLQKLKGKQAQEFELLAYLAAECAERCISSGIDI